MGNYSHPLEQIFSFEGEEFIFQGRNEYYANFCGTARWD